jgi:hypothetical protein
MHRRKFYDALGQFVDTGPRLPRTSQVVHGNHQGVIKVISRRRAQVSLYASRNNGPASVSLL